MFDYNKLSLSLIKTLSDKQREVLLRRFGLEGNGRETLEFIGKKFGVTRERVRQIERDGFLSLKSEVDKNKKVFDQFVSYLKNSGGLKNEDTLLEELGGEKNQAPVFFLLNLDSRFKKFSENENRHSLWSLDEDSLKNAEKSLGAIAQELDKRKKPMELKELKDVLKLPQSTLISYLGISKKIEKGPEGLFGLKEWPEINPKGIKDKAYLTFKKEAKPLHYTQVATFIGRALPQTVHNELIKDQRFVLVGRGTYALREWGYEDGCVKDVISKVLKTAERPLDRKEILKEVSKQRMVKENTVLLNLTNRNYFLRNSKGKYTIKEA